MTSRIHILDDTLVDQIAAGEVVERPASAVKELLENAVDAGASRIDLEIEDGGKTSIRVSDDGCGMSAEEATLAVRRHATSKIRSFDDLVRIRTLGFRGEALPSIASVSRFSLRTRPHDQTIGAEVRVDGGGTPQVRPAGGAAGTTLEIRDLFFNVPARRKFLKATHAEAARVHDAFLRVALAHPEIRFTYRTGGREIRALTPALGLPGRAAAIFPNERLEEVAFAERGLRIEAMLGAGETSRTSSRHLFLFVNGRAVIDAGLVRAITHGYGADLGPGRFPVGVVHLHLPPEEVDVNVHPQKTEVRLAHAHDRHRQIQGIIARKRAARVDDRGAVSRAQSYWEERLGGRPLALRDAAEVRDATPALAPRDEVHQDGVHQDVALRDDWPAGVSDSHTGPPRGPTQAAPPRDRWGVGAALQGVEPRVELAAAPAAAAPRARASELPGIRYIGRAHGHHLVCECPEGVLLVDGRRGMAQMLSERLTRALEAGAIPSRRLVFPPRLEVKGAPSVAENECARLARLGFDVGALSPQTLAIHAVPEALSALAPEEALRIALDLADDGATITALAEATARAAPIDDDEARAIAAFVGDLSPLPNRLARLVRLEQSAEPS